MKTTNINTLHRTKPHLHKIGGKWDYKPCLGHELSCFANNYMAHEHCHRVNKVERAASRILRTKCISSITELNVAANELLNN